MEGFLNILDGDDIFQRLSTLRPDAAASFGRMSAQHMVEHLVFVLRISNGKLPHKLYYSDEKAAKIRAYTFQSDKEFMVGFRAPMLPDEPVQLKFQGLSEAILQLRQELSDFNQFFHENPEATPTNPTMGPLNFQEWIIFHNKHFTHHFKQFQLS
jgi:oxepin-CoA hydrolase/3-oxo-5,6-dehydrosuberyl-CoA semialdehyde dehydrogenase